MPRFKMAPTPKCCVCGKSAYPNESVSIFGVKVHKACFNCHTCQKKLTLSDAVKHPDSGLLFCKTHFADLNRTLDSARFTQGPKNIAQKMAEEQKLKGVPSASALQSATPLDEDLEILRRARYDVELEAQITDWIEFVSQDSVAAHGDGTFEDGLRNGVLLCKIVNRIFPGSIRKFHDKPSQPFKQMENIKWFLAGARANLDMLESDMFNTIDLHEGKDMVQVLLTLSTMHRKISEQSQLQKWTDGYELTFRDMSDAVAAAQKQIDAKREVAAKEEHAKVMAKAQAEKLALEQQMAAREAAAAEEKAAKEKASAAARAKEQEEAAAKTKAAAAAATAAEEKASAAARATEQEEAAAKTKTAATKAASSATDASAAKSKTLDVNSQWHMLVGEDSSGPYCTTDMLNWFNNGDISAELWVSENGGEWQQARDFFAGASIGKEKSNGSGAGGDDGGDGDASSSSGVVSEPNPESQWHMLVNDESSGPYSTADMATWFKSGDISPELWVSENGAEWRQAKEFFSGTGGDKSASADPQPAAPEAGGGVAMTVPANDSWYMLVNDEQHGPYTAAQLRQWMESGDIDGGTWVSNGGQWAAARDALP